jgi:hypothetical protein
MLVWEPLFAAEGVFLRHDAETGLLPTRLAKGSKTAAGKNPTV